jgi:large subunit ribosomal protein L22
MENTQTNTQAMETMDSVVTPENTGTIRNKSKRHKLERNKQNPLGTLGLVGNKKDIFVAIHKNVQSTPRKASLLRPLILNVNAKLAIARLRLENRSGSEATVKLIKSAVAQSGIQSPNYSDFKIIEMVVCEGMKKQSFMPRARGSAYKVLKRCSHIGVQVSYSPETSV